MISINFREHFVIGIPLRHWKLNICSRKSEFLDWKHWSWESTRKKKKVVIRPIKVNWSRIAEPYFASIHVTFCNYFCGSCVYLWRSTGCEIFSRSFYDHSVEDHSPGNEDFSRTGGTWDGGSTVERWFHSRKIRPQLAVKLWFRNFDPRFMVRVWDPKSNPKLNINPNPWLLYRVSSLVQDILTGTI